MTNHLFISYKSEENPFTLKLAADLRNRGVSVWVDRLDILSGDKWAVSIDEALKSCSGMIAVLTPDYFTSHICQEELEFVWREKLPIFPVLLRTTPSKDMPFWLPGRQYIDFTGFLDESIYQQQLTSLYQRIQRDQSGAVGDIPGREMQYLTSLIADLETEQGVENYIALSGQSEVVRQNVRAQKRVDPSLALLLSDSKPKSRFDEPPERQPIADIHEAVTQHPKFVLIGEPGAGKTTTLRRLALEQARTRQEWLQNSTSPNNPPPIPLLVYLPSWRDEPTPADYVRSVWERETQLGGDPLRELHAGNIHLYLDGLNEMGADGGRKAQLLREWLAVTSTAPQHVIISCRQNDYVGDLDLNLPSVAVEPLTDDKIHEFALKYLEDERKAEKFAEKIFPSRYLDPEEERRSLIYLAHTPYLLAALLLIYQHGGDLPQNTGALFKGLVAAVWERERLRGTPGWIPLEEMQTAFGRLAFDMIDTVQPIDVSQTYAIEKLGDPQLLNIGRSAGFISLTESNMHFSHQLILEYFAAQELYYFGVMTRVEKPVFFSELGRFITRWEVVIISLCGIVSDPDTLILDIAEINPFLAAYCLASGVTATTAEHKVVALLDAALRKSKSSSLRLDIVQALGAVGSLKAVPTLIYTLNDEDEFVRMWAASVLGNIGSSEAIPNLIQALYDEDEDVHDTVTTALEEIIRLQPISALLQLLKEDAPIVRSIVVTALGQIGSPEVLPSLIKSLKDEDEYVRSIAASILGEIGNPKAVRSLIRVLNDKEAFVRSSAATSLGELNSDKAVLSLIGLLSDEAHPYPFSEERVCDAAAEALEKIGTPEALAAVRQWQKQQRGSG